MRIPVGMLKPGEEFVTTLTRRAGTVMERRRDGAVEVIVEGERLGVELVLRPGVLVEVA